MSAEPVLRVAVPVPLPGSFDYLPPTDPGFDLVPGVRLRVPFGRGYRCGVLLEIVDGSELAPDQLKRAGQVLDREPLLSRQDLELLTWASTYYRYPVGEVVSRALPVRLRKGAAVLSRTLEGWRLTTEGRAADMERLGRARRQAEIVRALQSVPDGMPQAQLYQRCGPCAGPLKALRGKGWVAPCQFSAPPPAATQAPVAGPELNTDQRSAVAAVAQAARTFAVFLLDGVTGSGKTEVYLKLVQQVLAAGRQALILVPEISLTPQLTRRFHSRLGVPITLLHSGMAETDRERAWSEIQSGAGGVLVGTRSAVFTPMPRLGLIVVDEEHDASLKQHEGFRYSARDLAVVRARRANCPVVLGSATPSLESLYNAEAGRYRRLVLGQRTGRAGAPRIELLDIRSVPLDTGMSPTLLRLVQAELSAGNQVLLFLNRRGYAPVLACHACGWLAECPRCDARLVVHRGQGGLWCHHCGYQRRIDTQCPGCGHGKIALLGQGTERMEERLSARFPEAGTVRVDRDSTRRRGALQSILDAVRQGRHSLLLGTQMLAKGHHFPRVTLVGVLDVDQGLFSADFRSAERMAQLITQVAGRAGRGDRAGQVLIQTRYPDHPLLQDLLHDGYGRFAAAALEERREANLPPFSYQALLRAEAPQPDRCRQFLEQASDLAAATGHAAVDIWGPVPAPMERRAGRYRAQLLLQSNDRSRLQSLLGRWVPGLYEIGRGGSVRWSLDVDPQQSL